MSSSGSPVVEMASRIATQGGQVASIWKSIALLLIGVVGSGSIAWATYVKNAVTRDDLKDILPGAIAQYSPYTTDAAALKEQLLDLKSQNVVLQENVQKLEVNVAQISEKLETTRGR